LTKAIGSLADYSRLNSDGIIALGDDMRDRLISRGIPPGRIQVVHNWADRSEIGPLPFSPTPLTIYYSGNLGLAHDTRTIQQAMLALASDQRIRFIFAGGGPRRNDLQKFCENHGLKQVQFRPYCDRNQLNQNLAEGHLGLVTQIPASVGSVVPSKVYGIMAAGRPVLYIGSNRATPAQIIERFNCGWRIEPGDSEGLVQLLTELSNKPDQIYAAGNSGRRAFVDNFDRRIGVARIAKILGSKDQSLPATV
jgi:glycosyltransferase involved in cell wall biosynthesis